MNKRGKNEYNVMERFKDGRGRLVSTVKMEPIYEEAVVGTGVKWKSVEKIYADFEGAVRALDIPTLTMLAQSLIK